MELFIKTGDNFRQATPDEIAESAAHYTAHRIIGTDYVVSPIACEKYLRNNLGGRSYECFCCLFLDARHRVMEFRELFRGTIDGAAVYPREVVKMALHLNAASVVLAHNHPSGNPEPSHADEAITLRIRDALALVDIRVLDHVIVTGTKTTSLASRGLL